MSRNTRVGFFLSISCGFCLLFCVKQAKRERDEFAYQDSTGQFHR